MSGAGSSGRRSLLRRAAARVRRGIRAHQIAAALGDPKRSPPILCASFGRVGSKMLYRSVIEGRARSIMGSFEPSDIGLIGSGKLRQAPIRPGRIVTTHALPCHFDPVPGLRIIFQFGKPSDTVLSVMRKVRESGAAWRDNHLRNMRADGDFDDLADRDILRLEEQIDAWRTVTDLPLLAIHYDVLWTAADVLDEFVGFAVPLPARRERRFDDMDPAVVAHVRRSYARLDEKVASLPLYWRSGV